MGKPLLGSLDSLKTYELNKIFGRRTCPMSASTGQATSFEPTTFLFQPIEQAVGVGSHTLRLLRKLHVNTVGDLLWHLPSGSKQYPLVSLKDMPVGREVTLSLKILSHQGSPFREQKMSRLLCEDQRNLSGSLRLIDLVFFQKAYALHKRFPVDSCWLVSGKVESFQGRLQMAHPERLLPLSQQRYWSEYQVTYPLTAGLSRPTLTGAIQKALKGVPSLSEWLPAALLQDTKWPAWREAVQALHRVTCDKDLHPQTPYRLRLAFDELLAEQLALLLARNAIVSQKSVGFTPSQTLQTHLLKAFKHPLTASQENVLQAISADLQHPKPMGRLLHGDVGSGKTIVAFAAMAPIVEAGFQVAFLVPTEILAQQQAKQCQALLEGTGLNVALLTSSTRHKQALYAQIQAGEVPIVMGTHALLEDSVQFKHLGMVVIDEQHRFGVAQRLKLTQKGLAPHLLVMSATPIPRTFELTRYGDLHISRLEEKPAGRLPVKTLLFGPNKKGDVLQSVANLIQAGGQGYWVCPLVEASESLPLSDVTSRFESLEKLFPGKVGLLHGQMKSEDKQNVIEAFRQGELRLLVATTVIEVGVNVPQATLMVVEHAERFGLAQLHQLRGRVGRGQEASYCFLLYNFPLSHEGQARLKILRESQDGFWIAEQDWLLRGGGDQLGTRQSGLPLYRVADLALHHTLLPTARRLAEQMLQEDPQLLSSKGAALRLLLKLFHKEEAVALLGSG
jgi:ATP-dependent DNA helicase RecG